MAFTPNNIPTLPKQPRSWQASIGNGDASAWKLLLGMAAGSIASNQGNGAGPNGSKISAVYATSNDTVARVVQLAKCRAFSGVTISNASPGVVTWSAANGNNLAVGDQVMFLNNGDTLPTGLSLLTTYFVISGGFTAGTSFELATSAGGTAINTTSAGSGTHVIVVIRPIFANTVPITGGTDGLTNTTDLLSLITGAGLPLDNDGQKYINLEAADFLAVSAATTVSSNKMISVVAEGGDF